MSLHKIFLNNSGNITNKWIHYIDIYEKHFSRFVGKELLILEIGVSKGGSIAMWKEYFGKNATIIGVDIDSNCKQYENINENVFVEIGNQSDTKFLDFVLEKYGIPTIVIDDGSHEMYDLVTTFKHIYHKLGDGSVYLVEDLHTCYIEHPYDGGMGKPNTFVELTKRNIDLLNMGNLKIQINSSDKLTDFWATTNSITCYDSIHVYEKKNQGKRVDLNVGKEILFNL
jgi:hypothetical protein